MDIEGSALAAMRRMADAGASSELIAAKYECTVEQVEIATGRALPDDLDPVFRPRCDGASTPCDPRVLCALADAAVERGGKWRAGCVTILG